jgi:hypothetical protein
MQSLGGSRTVDTDEWLSAQTDGGAMREDYPWIRAWGTFMGSSWGYVDQEIAQARMDKAPPHAIYREVDGTWRTTDDITEPRTRLTLGSAIPAEPSSPVITLSAALAFRKHRCEHTL